MAAPEPPAGAVLAHTQWGEPKSDTTAPYFHGEVEPNLGGGPYLGPDPTIDRAKRCKANDDTCMGWRLTNSDYCVGHTKALVT